MNKGKGGEANLSPDSAPIEKRAKRERKSSDVYIKPSTAISGSGCGGA